MSHPFFRRLFGGYVVARTLSGLAAPGPRPSAAADRNATADRDAAAGPAAPCADTSPLPPLEAVRLFGIDVCNLTFDEAVDRIIAWSRTTPGRTVITTNLDHVMKLRSDPLFRRCYDHADMVTADGMPFLWLAKAEGTPLKARVTGSDLILPLMEAAAREGCSVFLFGSTMDRLHGAATLLKQRFPALEFRGAYAPPFGFERNPALQEELLVMLRTTRPDLVLVALGAPKQEVWAEGMARRVRHGVFLSIGGGLDFLSGEIRRAPTVMRRTGTEWLWRALSEPSRLGPRYAKILLAAPQLYRMHKRDKAGRPGGDR
ncbi:WecB/TagA/CpsF family glycosyltransferase [Acuticoccus yangtzensis]|uniref:WecB/TagA/CpsF family glycosyltransferase n=1 Tax=Acuticoccus yangtzensis TaxID=1443441 RepID=UPI00094956C7|nr:WecB/TagA/CpsF family glycosyltransferase [Acuticoccus yangtzensis]